VRDGDRVRRPAAVRAVEAPTDAGPAPDLVLFTVKGYDTETAARALRPALGPRSAVLTLQNGVESLERLAAVLDPACLLGGTAVIEATIAEPGVVARMGTTPRITLGEPAGGVTPRAEAVAAALREAGVDTTVTPHVRRAIWEKFVRLAPGATITSACGLPIGAVRDRPEAAAVYRALVAEAVAVGRAAGGDLPDDAVDAAVRFIWALPATMKTSMQRDFERHGRVELDELPGAAVRLGRRLGVPTPCFTVLYAILEARAGGLAAGAGGDGP